MASAPPNRRLTFLRICAALALVLVLAGCRMDVDVGIVVAEDGSGTVTVTVTADRALLNRVPGAETRLKLDDLTEAGWTVEGPTDTGQDTVEVRISHPFANPAEMKELLASINGPGGPMHDFDLTITDEWDKTTWKVTGSAGLTGGVDSFVDPDLVAAFGASKPLDQLIEESGIPIEQALNLTITIQMPHQTALNVIHVPLDGRNVPIGVASEKVDQTTRAAAIVAGVCGALLAGWLAYWATKAVLRVGRRRDPFTSR